MNASLATSGSIGIAWLAVCGLLVPLLPVAGQDSAPTAATPTAAWQNPADAPLPVESNAPTLPWEYAPYEIRVWFAAGASAEFDPKTIEELQRDLHLLADAWVGAPWSLTVTPPPAALTATVAYAPERLTDAMIGNVDKEVLRGDKLVLVALQAGPRDIQIRVRELDCHTRTWSRVAERVVRQTTTLGPTIVDTMIDLFSPLVRIEEGSGRTCLVRARAAGLVLATDSPAYIGQGDVLLPVYRQNDRYGDPMPNRIQILPFTFLHVTSQATTSPSLLNCNVHSGMRSPIMGRPTSRRERWALKIRPARDATELIVESKPVVRTDPKIPLAGIEVFAKTPLPEPPAEETDEQRQAAERSNPTVLLGATDWRGSIQLERGGPELKILYIKNGGLLLARLPVVVGYTERLVAEVADDNPRLQAEGFVKGMHGEIMDLVVQRQLLRFRFRKQLERGKLDEAQRLLEEFRSLKSLNDLQRTLDQQMTRQKPTNHPGVKQRIDKLYADEREMIARYVDVEMLNQLTQELARARAEPATAADDAGASGPLKDNSER